MVLEEDYGIWRTGGVDVEMKGTRSDKVWAVVEVCCMSEDDDTVMTGWSETQ